MGCFKVFEHLTDVLAKKSSDNAMFISCLHVWMSLLFPGVFVSYQFVRVTTVTRYYGAHEIDSDKALWSCTGALVACDCNFGALNGVGNVI